MAEYLISEQQVPGSDNILILKDKEARQDLSTALATVTGNPLNFSTRSAQKANKTVISLEPIQDLHGYDYPWPAGGGKNILPMTVDGIKAANTSGTWSGDVYTISGVTFMILTDDGNNVTGILVNGTATDTYVVLNLGSITFSQGETYTISGSISSYDSSQAQLFTNSNNAFASGNRLQSYSGNRRTRVAAANETAWVSIYVYNGTTINGTFYPQIEENSTYTAFAPYSNICPIDGRTETSLVGCGKNLVDVNSIDLVESNSAGNKCLGLVFDKPGQYTAQGTPTSGVNVYAKKYTNGEYSSATPIVLPTTFVLPYMVTLGENDKLIIYTNYTSVESLDSAKADFLSAKVQVEMNPTATTYEPFVQSTDLTIQFGEKVYVGTLDVVSGELVVTWGIADLGSLNYGYNESDKYFSTPIATRKIGNNNLMSEIYGVSNTTSLSGMPNCTMLGSSTATTIWIKNFAYTDAETFKSAMNGVQLAYELATPRTIQLTPNEISLLLGANNISTDADGITLTYRDGKVATLGDLQEIANNLQEQIDQNETMEDETTQLLYKLGVNNGLLFIEEV